MHRRRPRKTRAALFLGCEVELEGATESWGSMARVRVRRWPQSCMVAGVLATTDLGGLHGALGGKLAILSRRDAGMRLPPPPAPPP